MTPVITITERETQLSAMLRTCTEALEATTKERDALALDAARWQAIKPLFRIMSLHMDGNHIWVMRMTGRLVGASMDEAADKLKGKS